MPGRLLGQAAAVLRPDPVVLESLKDLNQLLGGSHMRTVNEWLRILTQVITDFCCSCHIAKCMCWKLTVGFLGMHNRAVKE